MKDRIKELRKSLDMSQTEFGAKIGMKQNTIASYERGNSLPMDSTIKSICREFGVSEEWLRTGDGSMMKEKSRDEQLTEAIDRILSGENPNFKQRLVTVLSTLDEKQWAFLEEKLLEIVGERSVAPAEPRKTREEEADEVTARIREEILHGGEKASESGTPPAGAGIA